MRSSCANGRFDLSELSSIPLDQLLGKAVWYEVWIDESAPYLLLLLCVSDGDYLIADPALGTIRDRLPSLESAKNWLWEDEYTLVTGRTKAGA